MGYTYIIQAMYPNRCENEYSKAVTRFKQHSEKSSAFTIKDNRVEIRVFSAVKSVENLLWRAGLLDLIVKNQTACPITALQNMLTEPFRGHFLQSYNSEKFDALFKRAILQTNEHEILSLNNDFFTKPNN